MSLYQYANDERHVIDLTDGPVLDLTRASYFSADQGALEEAANRLLMALPNRGSSAGSTGGTPAVAAGFPVRTARAPRRIDVKTIALMTAVAAVGILLMAIAASAQY